MIKTLLLVFISIQAIAQQKTDSLKVLFVGNSYTYFWNMPQMVQAMADKHELPWKVRKSTAGGSNWEQHWKGEKGLKSKDMIAKGEWDIVILQNHSRSTLDRSNKFHEYGKLLIDWVRENGAEPVLYETWSRSFNPLMLQTIKSEYQKLAEEHKIDLVRVGELWEYVTQLKPDTPLYHPDGSHPSPVGSYLTACMFFQYLSKMPLDKVGERISTVDKDGELLYLAIIMEEEADFLKQSVSSFNRKQSDE